MNINEFLKSLKGKVVIAGIGNPLRQDDAVGSYIARGLKDKIDITVINCEDKPERYLEKIIEENPDTVLFIDALDMKVEAGSLVLLKREDFDKRLNLTHKTALRSYIDYICKRIKTEIFIIGIQPQSLSFAKPMSIRVIETAEVLKKLLIQHFNSK